MASLLAMIVMALSFYYGKVDFITVAERVAWTVFIVYPVTFFVVWRIVRVAMAELDVKTPEPDVEPKETETSATETDAGEGA